MKRKAPSLPGFLAFVLIRLYILSSLDCYSTLFYKLKRALEERPAVSERHISLKLILEFFSKTEAVLAVPNLDDKFEIN